MEYLKRKGYNVVEMWECNIRRELNEDEDIKHTLNVTILPIR